MLGQMPEPLLRSDRVIKKLLVVSAVVSIMLVGCGKTETAQEEVAPAVAVETVVETEAVETEEVVAEDSTVAEVVETEAVETEEAAQ